MCWINLRKRTCLDMSRSASLFKQSDITRALEAARDAGYEQVRVEVDTEGKKIVIIASQADIPPNGETAENVKKLI